MITPRTYCGGKPIQTKKGESNDFLPRGKCAVGPIKYSEYFDRALTCPRILKRMREDGSTIACQNIQSESEHNGTRGSGKMQHNGIGDTEKSIGS